MSEQTKTNPNTSQNSYLVLYDDDCGVCQTGIGWLKGLDKDGKTKNIPINESNLSSINPNLKLEECIKEIHVIGPDGEIYRGSRAIARLARLFPSTWIFGALISIPPFSWIANVAYKLFAKNRYRISKFDGNACNIPEGSTFEERK